MYGLKGDLEQISLENLQPSIDLKGLGAGVHSCLIKVNLSNGIRLMNKPVINVTITEREPETTTPAETESQSSPETASTEESTANMGMEFLLLKKTLEFQSFLYIMVLYINSL